ncbi:isoprenoid biosynthesis glyoxalase ElbB [Ferrimonas senticii]|uniref:isoprenoid biosynthesis glyoxalase ElbB n=1 Tax=Ferrimonas senticii TaxID=394566 RepID=UPI0004290EBB|nr:isoprenoid biosynthesis glyoxalase ElbB [Ferrimonas senticii]
MSRIAVILAGCGVFDGSEIHEAVLTLLALNRAGVKVQCFAPDRPQLQVINHLTGEVLEQQRNVLQESARIARGEVKPLTELNVADFDGVVVPGGFGVAKNLCDFAVAGNEMTVQADMLAAAQGFIEAGKPSGYLCIAPIMLPQIAGQGVVGTIGTDRATAASFNHLGGQHQPRLVEQLAIDHQRKIVSSPAYMLASNISEVAASVDALVEQLLLWVQAK